MGKRQKVPEDLMGAILEGKYAASSDDQPLTETPDPQKNAAQDVVSPAPASRIGIPWDTHPERKGVTFNLSKQVARELDRLRLELQNEEGLRSSNSEIAELALRIAIEETWERGVSSELFKRLSAASGARTGITTDEASGTPVETASDSEPIVERTVHGPGYILETTYSAQRGILSEELVGNVADLPVQDEYLDEKGRLITLSVDELGNVFERVSDGESSTLRTRLVRSAE